jgi:hypothetical protein
MTNSRAYGRATSGRVIVEAEIERLAAEVERGDDVDQPIARRNKRGRPMLGSSNSRVESDRLDAELRRQQSTGPKRWGGSRRS